MPAPFSDGTSIAHRPAIITSANSRAPPVQALSPKPPPLLVSSMRSSLQSLRRLRPPSARNGSPVLVTGSLFVVGEGREAIGLAEPDLDWLALNRAAATIASNRP